MHGNSLFPILLSWLGRTARMLALIPASLVLASCGGGGGKAGTPAPAPVTYSATSGVAQKGPLIVGSTIFVQELDVNLSPTGKQYTYQTNTDLGTFVPSSTFGAQYVGVNATGYYFDEVQGAVSGGTITLNAYCDLSAVSVLNVNLLTTLAYQRIQKLVTQSHLSFTLAQRQAEGEVLAALGIYSNNSFGSFNSLDISKAGDGDKMLAAISSLFVNGNTSGNLSALVASFQNDIADDGVISSAATKTVLLASAQTLSPAAVAANLNSKYASAGVTFSAIDISNWIDPDGEGVPGRFKFQIANATPSSVFPVPSSVVTRVAGTSVSLTGGVLSVNGNPVNGAVTVQANDALSISPPSGTFPNGVQTAYLSSGSTRVARVSFLSGLSSIAVTPADSNLPAGVSYQFTATGTFSDTSTADLTATVQWTSNAPAVVTINESGGNAHAVAPGQAVITAHSGGISGTAALSVTPAVLQSLAVTPNPFSTGIAIARKMTATGTYTDGSTLDLTSAATWTTLDPGVATVTGGLVAGVAVGSTSVTATSGTVAGTASLAVTANQWSPAASLSRSVESKAVLLPDGKVLLVGGTSISATSPSLNWAFIYAPDSDRWSAAQFMSISRFAHSATLLPNGKVLVAGGVDGGPVPQASTEIYDSAANTWSSAAPMNCGHVEHSATLLANGKILVVGGASNDFISCHTGSKTNELYDPVTDSWSVVAPSLVARKGHKAVLLPGDKVLIFGGATSGSFAEIYDSVLNTWTSASSPAVLRSGHTATLLSNGTVLVVGGATTGNNSLSSAEIYDPNTNSWATTGSMVVGRRAHTATMLADGRVLVAGGQANGSEIALTSSEIYDPASATWSAVGNMSQARVGHAAVLLQNTSVLVIGGEGTAGSCDLFW